MPTRQALGERASGWRVLGWTLGALYLLAVGFIVFWPTHVDDNSSGQWLRHLLAHGHATGTLPHWFTYTTIEWGTNVAMFVPGGFLACLLVRPRVRIWVLAWGVLASCVIECVQLFLPDRTSSLWDIAANSLGAALGWGLGMAVVRLNRCDQRDLGMR
ncbi:VanZ family protein [Rothia sp. LK2588]|uniref:VanZ family protein n=1 Tax=Rothia sp. LK2588 TaxID=3114369 RepID=UPI0034D01084